LQDWDGPPDVTITPLCRDGQTYNYAYADSNTRYLGDLDGDGSGEISVSTYGWYDQVPCGNFTMSLPSSGTVDPFTSPLAIDGLGDIDARVMGDWTGDGLPEVWLPTEHQVQIAPMVIDIYGVHGVDWVPANAAIVALYPQAFDLDGDGRPEVLTLVTDNVLTILPSDLDQLTDPEVTAAWQLGPEDASIPFFDRGHAWLAFYDWSSTTMLRRADLGPATEL
jgi:hypothetical protein